MPQKNTALPDELSARSGDLLRAFETACADSGAAPPDHPLWLQSAGAVFAVSDFAARSFIRNPSLAQGLSESGDLYSPSGRSSFTLRAQKAVSDAKDLGEVELLASLRLFRTREMLRIAWRDLAGLADVDETLAELSSLADEILKAVQGLLYGRLAASLGRPQDSSGRPIDLVCVAMGKLGGGELNFSSDIDLIFAYPENGSTENGGSNEDFFTRLCHNLTRALSLITEDGLVYRVDLRLRPYGESGPVALSFAAMEGYYQEQGREWERYAWLRGRPVTGDPAAGERLTRLLTPFVFRKYLDYGAFESLRNMKRMMESEVRKKGLANDVKMCAGGIREAEFVCQALQLLRGGVEPTLRERAILKLLPLLAERGLLPEETSLGLSQSYRFLRKAENRLQEFSDLQTHRLPDGDTGRLALAFSMGYESWRDFLSALESVRATVREAFADILSPRAASSDKSDREMSLAGVWERPDRADAPLSLSRAGYGDPERVLALLRDFASDPETLRAGERGRVLVNSLVPALLSEASEAEHPEEALSRILGLFSSICRRTTYLSLLAENPLVLHHLVRLGDASPMVSDLVKRHPMLLAELTDPKGVYRPPELEDLNREIARRLSEIAEDDLEEQMDALRAFKQVNVFRVAAADVTGAIYIMHVSDHLTEIAETVLKTALDLALKSLVARHGHPSLRLNGKPHEGRGFCVVALGKLGGIELSYGSDLDLVFLHAGEPGGETDGERPVDNSVFFARLGQKVVHILTAHTEMGSLYEADMRLRPGGGQGMLVSHVDAYAEYQAHDAWTWEHQALVRARPVAGDPVLAARFSETRLRVLRQVREPEALRQDVVSMRAAMRRELLKNGGNGFDLKQGEGGIVDIEFLVQYLVLLKAPEYRRLCEWTDNVRILEAIAAVKILPEDTASALNDAYLAFRTEAHRLALLGRSAVTSEARFEPLRNRVRKAWRDILED